MVPGCPPLTFADKTSCLDITDADAADFKNHLESCAATYHAGSLTLVEGRPWESIDTNFTDRTSCAYGNLACELALAQASAAA